jgi:hypothetical protein
MKLEERIMRLSKDGTGERDSSILSTTSNKRAYDQGLGTPTHRPKKKTKRESYSLEADGTLIEDMDVLDNTEAGE